MDALHDSALGFIVQSGPFLQSTFILPNVLRFLWQSRNLIVNWQILQLFNEIFYSRFFSSFTGLDNSICTFGGIMSYTTGQALRPFSSNSSSMLRVLLINSCVSRNTKALVAQVKENRVNLMPKVAASILESMDRVAREAAETLAKLLNNNNNLHDQGLFHKLEVNISNQF